MRLVILKETPCRVPRTALERLFAAVTRAEKATAARHQVNLIFVDDKAIRRLNREFRGKDKATDVLSFNLDALGDWDGILGEVYIALPYARRQAADYGATEREEILRLFCHGLLHLFGYDHGNAREEKTMMARQDRYLEQLRARKAVRR